MRALFSAFLMFSFMGLSAAPAQQAPQAAPSAAEQTAPSPAAPPAAAPNQEAGQPAPPPAASGSAVEEQTASPAATTRPGIADQSAPQSQQDEVSTATLDANGKPVEPAPCARKDKECAKKRKALLHHKEPGMKIEDGTLTVDGWTGKARLNYDIQELKFLYVSIPGVGTVVASMQQFPNSIEQRDALDGKTLTLKTPDDHIVQLSSDGILIDKKQRTFFVRLDTTYVQPGRFPAMGYGTVALAPYAWPGARPMSASEQKLSASAPPLPLAMQAKQVQLPCQKVMPGQKPTPVKVNGISMTPEACKSTTAPPPDQPVSALGNAAAPAPVQ